ncbi:MAG: mechanosensitive ion channel family protein [Thermoplasmata archaeon]|nr:MAG: mechanosensitive ion channel family protein [Thermoplasmata archaeon]
MVDLSDITGGFSWFTNINWLQILIAIVIFILGVFIAYLARKLLYRALIKFVPKTVAHNTARIIYYALVIIFAISALGTLGIDLTGLIIAGGIIGIILGFALQSVTANLVSGLFLYWERPLKPGDVVEVDGHAGVVLDISIMSTKIRGFDGVLIRVPNEKVFSAVIKNIGANVARRLEFVVGIAYKEDAERAIDVIMKVISEHPFVLVYPEPEAFVSDLGSSSVNIAVRVWTPTSEWMNVRKELLWRIKRAITEAGIEIPFPQSDVWFRSPLEVRVKSDDEKE